MNDEFHLGTDSRGARRVQDRPFRILLMADCTGQTSPAGGLGERTIHRLDLDRFEAVLAKLEPALELDEHGRLAFTALDEFHPDRLCRRSPVLARLLETYRALSDPAQASRLLDTASDAGDAPSSRQPADNHGAGSDLERLLGGKVGAGDASRDPALIRHLAELVSPHLVDSRAAEPHRKATEQTLAEQLQGLLHDARFQRLEACWRGLWWLVTQLSAEEIELYLLPVSRAELQRDVEDAGTDLAGSALFGQLFRNDQARNWSTIAAVYDFGANHSDIQALSALSAMAVAGRCALLASATPTLAGCDSAAALAEPGQWQPLESDVQERWRALRNSQAAAHVALGLPRLLLRAPYDKRNDPIDSFDFSEDVTDDPETHAGLLWGSPALGLAAALGRMFQEYGWEMNPASAVQLEDLASFSDRRDGEPVLRPAAEAVLGEQAIEELLKIGLTPFLGSRNRIDIIMPGCVSLAASALHGPWNA